MKANEVAKKTTIGEIYYRLNCNESKFSDLPSVRDEHDWDIEEASWDPRDKVWTPRIKANIEPDEAECKEEADD